MDVSSEDNASIDERVTNVSAKDLGFEDSEDELQMQSLREELRKEGYEISDDLDFAELEVLHARLYKEGGREQRALSEFAAGQKQQLESLLAEVKARQATLLPSGVDYLALQEESTFSVDSSLGRDLCVAVSRWINNVLREDPDITNEDVYETFVATHDNFRSRIVLHSDLLRRYMYTYIPIVKENIARNCNVIRSNERTRSRLAHYLNRTEIKNTEALISAKSYSVIRQIYEFDDGHFETKCPRCGESIRLDMPVFRIIAFASESRPQKKIFVGHIGCKCGNALLFKSEEYRQMLRQYRDECFTGIDAYMNEAKTVSQGAVELITSIPISVVKDYLPLLFVHVNKESAPKHEMVGADDNNEVIMVDDKEFDQAVAQFYFKLRGLGDRAGLNVSDCASVNTQNDGIVVQAVDTESTKHSSDEQVYWTYHDTAVYVMQCLSKEYYTEHKRALFSLIASINGNPHLSTVLSAQTIWDLQDAVVFLSQFENRKNVRVLQPAEINQLQFYIVSVAKQELLGEDKLLEQATACIDILKKQIDIYITERIRMLDNMSSCADLLAFTKILRMNSCRAEDLQRYLCDEKSARLFNEIADRMLIKTYAGEFFEYWRSFNIVRSSTLDNIFVVRSNANSIKKSLEELHSKLFYKSESLSKFKSIYNRDTNYESSMSKLHRDYLNVDYYGFCKDLASIDTENVTDSATFEMLVKMSQLGNVANVVSKTKAEVYLTDFTPEEIAGCAACNDLVFGRYIPIRQDNESIDKYCERFEREVNNPDFLKVRDTLRMFDVFHDYILQLSICSIIADAEFKSRGKSIFMDALLCECCGDSKCSEFLTSMIGVSKMQQNIIKSIEPDYVLFDDASVVYKILHGIYMSSIHSKIENLCRIISETNIFATMTSRQMYDALNIKDELVEIVTSDAPISVDGDVPEDDKEDALIELTDYFGDDYYAFEEWLGVKA